MNISNNTTGVFMKKILILFLVLAGCTTPKDRDPASPPEQPPTTTVPQPPPPAQTAYNVYPGCAQPLIPTNTVVIDSATGEDFAAFVTAKKIQPGMHIVLKGHHKYVSLNKFKSPALVGNTSWLWIQGQGASIDGLSVADFDNLIVSDLSFKGPGQSFLSANLSNLILINNSFSTTDDISSYGLTEWMAAASAIQVRNGTCASITNNTIKNVRFGISVGATSSLIENNSITNFSGDAFRALNSKIIIKNNTAKDSYMAQTEGDPNHDDGIQLFSSVDTKVGLLDDILIEGNTIIATTDFNRSHIGTMQGIGAFDSVQNRITIKGNTIQPAAYHALSLYGANDSIIENNTIICLYKSKTPWIGVFKSKTGRVPMNTVVRNNTAPKFNLVPEVLNQSNKIDSNCLN